MNRQPGTYTATAVRLHWCMALLILAAFPLGLYMSGLPLSPTKLRLFSYHKWIGVTVALLAVYRLAWRMSHRPPALPATMSAGERWLAAGVHWMLYALMFAVPVSGWLMSSALGFQTVWFGVVPLPDVVERNKELGALLKQLHVALVSALVLGVAGHATAAVRHHWVRRDNVLGAMVPRLRQRAARLD